MRGAHLFGDAGVGRHSFLLLPLNGAPELCLARMQNRTLLVLALQVVHSVQRAGAVFHLVARRVVLGG